MFTFSSNAFANETFINADAEEDTIIYQDDEITVKSLGKGLSEGTLIDPEIIYEDDEIVVSTSENFIPAISLFSTATGPGGTAKLDASSDRRNIYWSVKPKTIAPWFFRGTLKLRYYSGFSRDVDLTGYGAVGSTWSGIVSLNANNGGVVYLSGSAYAANGSLFNVLPEFNIAF